MDGDILALAGVPAYDAIDSDAQCAFEALGKTTANEADCNN